MAQAFLFQRNMFGLMKVVQMQGITFINMDMHCVVKALYTTTVEPPNNGQVGDGHFVHYSEVVPSSEVPPPRQV